MQQALGFFSELLGFSFFVALGAQERTRNYDQSWLGEKAGLFDLASSQITDRPISWFSQRIFLPRITVVSSTTKEGAFRGRNFVQADLSEAKLGGIDFSSSNLSYANLRNADLRYSRFHCSAKRVRNGEVNWFDVNDGDAQQSNEQCANLYHADLSYADLKFASFSQASMALADFSYANLERANLSLAWALGADFKGATLPRGLGGFKAPWVDMRGARLLGTSGEFLQFLPNLESESEQTDLSYDFYGADLRSAVLFINSEVTKDNLGVEQSNKSENGAELDALFNEADDLVAPADFRGAVMYSAESRDISQIKKSWNDAKNLRGLSGPGLFDREPTYEANDAGERLSIIWGEHLVAKALAKRQKAQNERLSSYAIMLGRASEMAAASCEWPELLVAFVARYSTGKEVESAKAAAAEIPSGWFISSAKAWGGGGGGLSSTGGENWGGGQGCGSCGKSEPTLVPVDTNRSPDNEPNFDKKHYANEIGKCSAKSEVPLRVKNMLRVWANSNRVRDN